MVILKQFMGDLIGAEHISTVHHFRAIFDENEQADEMSKPLGNNPRSFQLEQKHTMLHIIIEMNANMSLF